ncbi:hypothetical protein D3C73_1415720 [compost metagenome]
MCLLAVNHELVLVGGPVGADQPDGDAVALHAAALFDVDLGAVRGFRPLIRSAAPDRVQGIAHGDPGGVLGVECVLEFQLAGVDG